MHPGATRADWSWFRTFAALKPGAEAEVVRAKLAPILRGFQEERASAWKTQTKSC